MQVSNKIVIGNTMYLLTGQGNNLYEAIKDLQMVKSLHDVRTCGCCGSANLRLKAYETKEKSFKYTVVQCQEKGCYATLNISENQSSGEKYYKKDGDGKFIWNKFEKRED